MQDIVVDVPRTVVSVIIDTRHHDSEAMGVRQDTSIVVNTITRDAYMTITQPTVEVYTVDKPSVVIGIPGPQGPPGNMSEIWANAPPLGGEGVRWVNTAQPAPYQEFAWDVSLQKWSPLGGMGEVHATPAPPAPTNFDIMWVDIDQVQMPAGPSQIPLDWLSDVDTKTSLPYDGAGLVYKAATGQWEPGFVGGGAGLAYRHVQDTAATVWIINHTLTFRPNVIVVANVRGLGLEQVWADIMWVTTTQVKVTLAIAMTGEAYLS